MFLCIPHSHALPMSRESNNTCVCRSVTEFRCRISKVFSHIDPRYPLTHLTKVLINLMIVNVTLYPSAVVGKAGSPQGLGDKTENHFLIIASNKADKILFFL